MTSIAISIKKICVTPMAFAKGVGYQIKKTNPIIIIATTIEIARCPKKNLIRLDIL